jgi:hypothetical protein
MDQLSPRGSGPKSQKSTATSEVAVQTISLDNVILALPPQQAVLLLKVDVQGYEAQVFKGLQRTLAAGRVRYILFEYWVDAIDVMSNHAPGSCSAVDNILQPLTAAGYDLFDLSLQAHPLAGRSVMDRWVDRYYLPLGGMAQCRWYAERGARQRQNTSYGMGYWTDVLAVFTGEFETREIGQLVHGGRKFWRSCDAWQA